MRSPLQDLYSNKQCFAVLPLCTIVVTDDMLERVQEVKDCIITYGQREENPKFVLPGKCLHPGLHPSPEGGMSGKSLIWATLLFWTQWKLVSGPMCPLYIFKGSSTPDFLRA